MAREKKTIEKARAASGEEIPRFQMEPMGNTGLKISSGIPTDNVHVRELLFPNSMSVYAKMGHDSTIASALNLFTMLIQRSKWSVRAPLSARDSAGMKENVEFLKSVMHDMDSPFSAFLQEVSSKIQYGFCVHEKVYRKRLKSKGSRFNDGKIGIKKLPVRSQTTITKFLYDTENELAGVKQNLAYMQTGYAQYANTAFTTTSEVVIPKSKLLLFRTGTQRDNPVGRSSLASVYFDWKYRCSIQENESVGVARDLGGIPIISIPPQYLSAEASPDQKAILAEYKNIIRNLNSGNQAGVIMPMAYDEISKQPLFKLDLLSLDGSKLFDTDTIIARYDRKILTTLMSDLLIMGQGTGGSYSLGTLKSELVNLAAESHLQEIADVLNKDLVPQLFQLNGIDAEYYPEFYFEDLSQTDVDLFSKFVQRVAAVGFLEKDVDTLNKIRSVAGIEPLPSDFDIEKFKEETSKTQSKSGQGMESGLNAGTGDQVGLGADASTNNLENAA